MEKNNKKTLMAAVGVAVFLLAGAVILTVFLTEGASVSALSFGTTGSANLTVDVMEGKTNSPIADAQVVILETGKAYTTDANGKTGTIQVPVIRDTRYDKIIPKAWGEISLIVYKDGFLPYALFYLQVADGQTRKDVKILMFENDSTGNSEPFSIIEGPNRAWVDELVKMYQPKTQ